MNDKKLNIVNLRMYRMILNLTCDNAANECGISIGYYNRIENGNINWIQDIKKRESLIKFYNKISRKAKLKMFVEV